MARPDDATYEKLAWLLKRLGWAEDYCRPYFERAKRHYRLYRFGSAVNDADWPYVNRVRSRDILAFIEDATATMVQSLLGEYPFYSVLPRNESQLMKMIADIDAGKIAKQMEAVLSAQVSHEDTEFMEEMTDFFKGGGIFGNSYSGVYPKFDPVSKQYKGPLIKTIDFWDVLPVPPARRISKARGVFVREFMDIEELAGLERGGYYKGIDELKAQFGNNGANPDAEWHKQLLNECGIADWMPNDEGIEVLHYFSGGHIISIANRSVILRDSNEANQQTGNIVKPFPYDLPVVQYKYMPVPLEFFAMGIPEVLEVLQEDKNLIRSARRDNIDICIQKIIKARAGADINYDLIKFYAGAIWPLENLTDIEPLDIPDVTASSYNEEQKVSSDMENALSMFGYARGMTPQHQELPTTVMKLQQASLNRLDLAIKLAEFTTLQQIADRVILLTRRYMPQAEYEAIIGEPDAGFYKLSEDAIRKFYVIKPMGSSVTHIKELRQQQIQAAFGLLSNVMPIGPTNIQPFTVDMYEASKTALEAYDIKNIDQLLPKLDMMMPAVPPTMPPQGQMEELQSVDYGGQ
jgi:hypothetical protein